MHTRASNSKLVKPLLEPKHDEPMWAADHVVAPTPGSAITIPETVIEFAIKGNAPKLSWSQSVQRQHYQNLLSWSKRNNPRSFKCRSWRLADKQSGRPSGSLPSNTQPNPKGHNSKSYQPLQSHNEHANVVFTRSGKSYNPPVNQNDQQYDKDTLINFDSDDEDEEPTPQQKIKNLKPVKETPLPKLYKQKILYPQRLRKEKMEAQYGKFLDMIRAIRINIPLIDRQLNLGVGTEQIIFNIDSAMKHSYSNDDTCFSIDVIDEILEEDFDALLDEEPATDLELKPLPDNLEYVFLEEPSFLPVIISSQLSKEKKSKLIPVLKKHKQAFAWKMTYIPGICPSFCKHKIQLLDDKKPVVQKQRRLNLNMQEVVKKEIVKLLDTGIIYPIVDSPWVSPIHYVPKKGGITVVTNENDELVPTRTITDNPAIWSRKLDDALWAFRTAYKTPTGTTPYKLIYGKNCHLPFEIEHHRAYWALKNCNPDLILWRKEWFSTELR
ncbi:hypothetical protein Tco_0223195 [Tanacetum coccineum]